MALLMAAVVILGAWFLKQTPLSTLIPVLRSVKPVWVLAGLGCMFGYVSLESVGSRSILRALGHKVTWKQCMGFSTLGFCGSSITPSSSGGQPFQVWAMSRRHIPVAHGSLTMLLLAACYQTAMLTCGLVGCIILGGVPGWGSGVGWLLLLGVSVNLALTLGMLCVMFLPRPARGLTMGALNLLVRLRILRDAEGAAKKAEAGLRQYAEGAECIRRNPLLILRVYVVGLFQVLSLALVPWTVCLAFGVHGSPVTVVATQMVLTLAVAAFPMPGAVGAAEGGFLSLFQPIVGSALAAPAMLLSRGVSFYLFLPLCALTGVVLNRRKGAQQIRPERAVCPGTAQKQVNF